MNQSGQQTISEIQCPIHRDCLIEYLNLSKDALLEKRVMCSNCSGQDILRIPLTEAYDQHREYYAKCTSRTVFKQMTFISIVEKQFSMISKRLKEIAECFESSHKELKKLWENFEEVSVQNENSLFHIENLTQLINFAEIHYQIFYDSNEQINDQMILGSLHDQLEQLDEKIKILYEATMLEIKNNMIILDNDFRMIENIIQTKILQKTQIENSIFGCFDAQFQLLDQIKFFADEKNFFLLSKEWNDNNNKLRIYQFDSSKRPFFQIKNEKNLDYNDVTFCCFHENSQSFITTKSQLIGCSLQFWSTRDNQFILEQELDGGIEQVKHLEIDQEHNICFSFHENNIKVWKYDQTWNNLSSIQCSDFKSVQFNSNFSLFAVQKTFSQQSLFFFPIYDNQRIGECQEINFQYERENYQIDQMFFTMQQVQGIEHIIIFCSEELTIYEIDLQNGQIKISLTCTFGLQKGRIQFCSQTNIFSLMNQDQEILMLYKLQRSGTSKNKYSIHVFSQIHSLFRFVNASFSKKGKFLAVVEQLKSFGPALIQQVKIQQYISLKIKLRETFTLNKFCVCKNSKNFFLKYYEIYIVQNKFLLFQDDRQLMTCFKFS